MEKTLLYPYDAEAAPILRHRKLLINQNISRVCSFKGWGLSGKDAGAADYGQYIGIEVNSNFEEALKDCDTVIFPETRFPINNKLVVEKIRIAMELNKRVICLYELDLETKALLQRYGDPKEKKILYYSRTNDGNMEEQFDTRIWTEERYKINTPVVFVLGLTEKTNKFEIQLCLREYFLEKGYKVSQIGTRHYCELFGFHSFPSFMFNSSLPEWEKILLLNRFIKYIEINEKPDLIIIGVPGGIMPFSDKFTNKFGVLAFEVSQAVTPDASVLSISYADYESTFFERLMTSLKYKLGVDISCFNMSNAVFDSDKSDMRGQLEFNYIDSIYVDKRIKKYRNLDYRIFNILNPNDSNYLPEYIENKLASFSDITAI